TKHQGARVAVAGEQWVASRQAALAQGVSVSGYLGRLVEKELQRREGRPSWPSPPASRSPSRRSARSPRFARPSMSSMALPVAGAIGDEARRLVGRCRQLATHEEQRR
ncbi:MAG: hypothetical protein WKF41_19385, partial [Gaiellaceae bacterium]